MSVAEKTCRTCGKTFDLESGLCPLYNSIEYENEIKMTLEEFEVWNLNITQNDGLPQKICLTCFDSFCQIHNFRLMCIEAQMNFGEMCTGLDIIIKDEMCDKNDDIWESFEGEQLVIVQEHYTFPGDELLKKSTSEGESTVLGSAEADEEITEKGNSPNPNDREKETEQNSLDLKKYRCDFCMGFVSFDDPDDLNKHYNVLHSSNLPFPCPKCDLCFDKAAKRNSHVRCHFDVTPLQCEHCGKKFRGDKQMMDEHIAYYHVDKDRECTICHLKLENVSLKRYYYHMQWHDDSKLLKCKFCDKKFIQSLHLQCHEKTHTSETKYICKECGLVFKNAMLLKKHILLHETKELTECPKCPKRFFTRIGIHLHNIKVHRPDKKPTFCSICNRTFSYANGLAIHNHKKHGAPAPKVLKRTSRPISDRPSALRIMKKLKKREYIKPYKCDKCEESFVLEVQFIRHLKIHDEHRPHQCKLCPKRFKREAHLKLHVDCIHFNIKPHKCLLCEAAFVQKSHLTDHNAIKHGVYTEYKKNYQCKVCQKMFGTSQILKTHMITHTDERPYVCKICQKTFKRIMVLKSHMTTAHLWKSPSKENEVKDESAQLLK